MTKIILIVEDDRGLASACSRALEAEGYTCRQAHDGLAAIDAATETVPDLILLDLLLPKKDGREVLRTLAGIDASAQIPVVAMSGIFKGRTTERELEDLGAKGFLAKPFPTSALIAEVQGLIGRPHPQQQSGDMDYDRARLGDVPAAEFLWRAMSHGFTGVVHFRHSKLSKMVLLDRGKPVAIRSNSAKETLGRRLLAKGRIDQKTHEESIRRSKAGSIRQGAVLVEMGVISEKEIEKELTAQTTDKLLDIFAWADGEAWTQAGIERLSYASALEGWTPHRTVLHGVTRMRYEQVMGVLTAFAERRIVMSEVELHPRDAKIPAVQAAFSVMHPGLTVGEMLAEHPFATYGLWLIGALQFVDKDSEAATCPTLSDMLPPSPEGKLGQLRALLEGLAGQTYWEVLGVAEGAGPKEIQAQYMRLAKRYHPDRFSAAGADVKEAATAVFSLLSSAKDTLIDPQAAREYKAKRSGGSDADDRAKIQRILDAERSCREGEALLKRRDYPAALTKFDEALKLNPAEGEFHALWAWAHFISHEADPGAERIALEKIQQAIDLAPESPKGYYYLAQLHKACGRQDQARKLFKQVTALDPEHVEARQALRLLNLRKGKGAEKASGSLFGFGKKKD